MARVQPLCMTSNVQNLTTSCFHGFLSDGAPLLSDPGACPLVQPRLGKTSMCARHMQQHHTRWPQCPPANQVARVQPVCSPWVARVKTVSSREGWPEFSFLGWPEFSAWWPEFSPGGPSSVFAKNDTPASLNILIGGPSGKYQLIFTIHIYI